MISPIRNFLYKPLNFSKIKPYKREKDFHPAKNSYQHLNYLNFRGYLPNISSFEDTVKNNYFRLPVVESSDGSTVQIQPDKSQLECAKKLYKGDSVIFCAPTGTGKTAVAHYIISKNLDENKKTIYTTPLKALANDKLREFRKVYGEDKVGLLTGDIKINTTAPIQIMTTEIYNNQVSSGSDLKNLGTIIFDEAHYLGDSDRGNVWENAIVHTPFDKVQTLLLSATIGNSDEVVDWIRTLSPTREVSKVETKSTERFVPLIYYIHQADYHKDLMAQGSFIPVKTGKVKLDNLENLTDRQKRAIEILYKEENKIDEYSPISEDNLVETLDYLKNQFGNDEYDIEEFKRILSELYPDIEKDKLYEVAELLSALNSRSVDRIHVKPYKKDNFPALIKDLESNNMLPALIFKLSKKGATNVCLDLKDAEVDLTTEFEKEEISKIIDKYKKKDIYLGSNFDRTMLLRGYAYHHAGELPQYKKLIEELFSKKLLKVISATSTLSAGINMPAKTVVVTGTSYKIYNPVTDTIEPVEISANDFHQMTGRAGRRGIDSIGNVVFYNLQTPDYGFKKQKPEETASKKSKYKELEEAKPDELQTAYNLLEKGADSLRSFFKPDWQSLALYYLNNSNDNKLKESVSSYFKYYLSKNKDKELKSMMNKFERYKRVLLKQGFIELDNKKNISITPKGKILTMSQGINPLLLSSLLYDGVFKELEPEQICQVLGYLAGSENRVEDENLPDIVNGRLKAILKYDPNGDRIIEQFNSIREKCLKTEEKILKSQKESIIPPEDIIQTESFSGYASFMWAYLNDKEANSVSNFRKIAQPIKFNLQKETEGAENSALEEYIIKSSEGNTYKIFSQVVSMLKQIIRICDYTLSNPTEYKNVDYWKTLRENSETAMLMVEQNPVWDEEAL